MLSPPAASLLTALQAVVVLCAIIVIGRSNRTARMDSSRASALLSNHWAPAVAGLVTFAIVRIVWGSFHEPGIVHDERAYLLQAEIFARGRWTAPAPPLATFFEQMHVFIEPAVFAKYPPAHAVTLAPGVWLGLPGLMPALMTGLCGALVFSLARRLADAWTALITWWLWTTAWATLMWSASYFSETTSAAMWLSAVWATLRWRDRGRNAYLLVVSATLAWGLAARPLTMAVLSVPLMVAILRRTIATRQWTALVAPAALGVAVLLILPAWNYHTLGDWRRDPYPQYSRVYFPFDKPGFGVDETPPLRPLVPEMVGVGAWSRDLHARYTLGSVPLEFVERAVALLVWCSGGWRLALGVLILAGVRRASGVARAGVITVALLLLAYLSFAHPPMWIVYYFEVLPILYFLAAREIGQLLQKATGPGNEAGWTSAMLMMAMLLLPFGANDVRTVRAAVDDRNRFNRSADAVLAGLPPGKAIVFVSYPASHDPHLALTGNEPDLASAPHWLVYDRGEENEALRALAPDRAAYRLDAATMRIERLP